MKWSNVALLLLLGGGCCCQRTTAPPPTDECGIGGRQPEPEYPFGPWDIEDSRFYEEYLWQQQQRRLAPSQQGPGGRVPSGDVQEGPGSRGPGDRGGQQGPGGRVGNRDGQQGPGGRVSGDTQGSGNEPPRRRLPGGRLPYRPPARSEEDVREGEWPWLVIMYVKYELGLRFKCVGSLVSKSHVLTAEHCVKPPNENATTGRNIILHLGRHNIRSWSDPYQTRDVKSVQYHNNMALMELGEPISVNDKTRPACPPAIDFDPSTAGTATVLGWGRDEDGHVVSHVPKRVQMNFVAGPECIASSPKFQSALADGNSFCAGNATADTGPCVVDSGSGIYFPVTRPDGSTRWVVGGVVTRTVRVARVCDRKHFTLFTKVGSWLKQALPAAR